MLRPLSPFFSLVFIPLSVRLWHPKRCADVVCVQQFFSPVPLPVQLFSLSVLRASCSSRMCSTETIVKKPRWQETRLRKTKISIYFLTTSFHFLPVGSMLFLTQLQGKRCIIVSLHVLLCPVVLVFVIDFKNFITSVAKVGEMTHYLPWHNRHQQGNHSFLSHFMEEH